MANKVEKKLSKLHELLCDELTRRIKSDECTTSDLNVLRQFLKDNNVDAVPVEDSPLGDLLKELPSEFKESISKH